MCKTGRRSRFFAMLFITVFFILQYSAAFAAPPANSVNLGYDLTVTSDWSIGESNEIIAPAGETVLFAADWHTGSYTGDEWIHAANIAYAWSSSDTDVVSGIREVASWYDPQPDWDPVIQVPGSYAQASTSFDNLGTSQITCTARAVSPYMLTGRTQSSVGVNVVGLTAEPVPEFTPIGRSVMLSAYWTPGDEWTKDEARQFFIDKKADLDLWGGAADEWTVTRLVTPAGTEITAQTELREATGGISRVDGTFGCVATVTPARPGTYTFACVPSVGSSPVEVEVRIMQSSSAPAVAGSSPAGSQVLLSPFMPGETLSQRFSVDTVPGFDTNGTQIDGVVYWSVESGIPTFDTTYTRAAGDGNDQFIRGTGGSLYTGGSYTVKLTADMLQYTSGAVRAWVVPARIGISEESIIAYGRQHPDCIREWRIQEVTGPVIKPLENSVLKVGISDGKTVITGLSATPAGSMGPREVLDNIEWNAGSETRITDADGMQLNSDRNVGTGCILSILFPRTSINGVYGVFVVSGDVTGSGSVSLTDVVRMARAMSDPSALTGVYLEAGDFTGTGRIDLTDIVTEARLMRGLPVNGQNKIDAM